MDHDTLVRTLTDAGLSRYEAEVFLSVLELTDANVADITDVCTVPRSRVYDILRRLEEKGYITTYEQDSLRARVDDPSMVTRDLNDSSERFSLAADGVREIWKQPRSHRTRVNSFQSHDQLLQASKDLLSNASSIVHLSISLDELSALRGALSATLARGVIVRITVHEGVDGSTDIEDLDPIYSEVASEVRFCTSLMPFIALVDGHITIFGINDHREYEYGVIVDDHTLSSILHWYFQIQLWEPWGTLYTDSGTDETIYVSIREFIRDLESVRESDEKVVVRVTGIDNQTGESVEIIGPITDIIYADVEPDTHQAFGQPIIQAAISITDEDREFTVGGYGAIVEDVRATQVAIVSIG